MLTSASPQFGILVTRSWNSLRQVLVCLACLSKQSLRDRLFNPALEPLCRTVRVKPESILVGSPCCWWHSLWPGGYLSMLSSCSVSTHETKHRLDSSVVILPVDQPQQLPVVRILPKSLQNPVTSYPLPMSSFCNVFMQSPLLFTPFCFVSVIPPSCLCWS